MDNTDMIGLLIVAVVAVGGIAFMIGGLGSSEDAIAGQAIQTVKVSYGSTPIRAIAPVPTERVTTSSRPAILAARATRPGEFISAQEILTTLTKSEVDKKSGNQICQMLGFSGCSVIFGRESRWYYASTNRLCEEPLQYASRTIIYMECGNILSWADVQQSRMGEPNTPCEHADGAEPHLGDSKVMPSIGGILCQK